jgi:hypothetical protein
MNKVTRTVSATLSVLALVAAVNTTAAHAAESTDYTPIMVMVTQDTPLYYEPGKQNGDENKLVAGQTWYLLGQDATGNWIKVAITPTVSSWVPRTSLALGKMQLPVVS